MKRLFDLLPLLAAAFLLFMAGAIATYFKLPPYGLIERSVLAYEARAEKQQLIQNAAQDLPVTERSPIKIDRKPGAFAGYTLFSGIGQLGATLIDMDGRKLHEWSRPFSQTWKNDHPQVADPLPDNQLFWRDSYLYPNGDMLVVHEANGADTPYGYGLAKIDRDSKLIWHYSANVHHRVHVAPGGMIYAISQQYIKAPEAPGVHFCDDYVLNDWIEVLTPEGRPSARISLLSALLRSPYAKLLETSCGQPEHDSKTGDILHTNSVMPLDAKMASAFPMFKAGQVLVSMRSLNAIGVVDLAEGRFVWLVQGPWIWQHDAEFLADGTILLFDNKQDQSSRIIKYDPGSKRMTVLFEGNHAHPFYSPIRGMKQLLPNDNLLLTESESGRMIEVTAKGEIVWEMHNPFEQDGSPLPLITGKRFAPGELTFLRQN